MVIVEYSDRKTTVHEIELDLYLQNLAQKNPRKDIVIIHFQLPWLIVTLNSQSENKAFDLISEGKLVTIENINGSYLNNIVFSHENKTVFALEIPMREKIDDFLDGGLVTVSPSILQRGTCTAQISIWLDKVIEHPQLTSQLIIEARQKIAELIFNKMK